ncbi:hypothetical protein XBJ2_1660001 [Xenorhabdus bovienii str. Jollieti]|nr:hypothetical protein XBJ2_1660001 [Xenorhabdus bovienii str. Jollieti]
MEFESGGFIAVIGVKSHRVVAGKVSGRKTKKSMVPTFFATLIFD